MNELKPAIGAVTEMECPTCGVVTECIYGADPYAEEIAGNDTPVWECAGCRHESAMDI